MFKFPKRLEKAIGLSATSDIIISPIPDKSNIEEVATGIVTALSTFLVKFLGPLVVGTFSLHELAHPEANLCD